MGSYTKEQGNLPFIVQTPVGQQSWKEEENSLARCCWSPHASQSTHTCWAGKKHTDKKQVAPAFTLTYSLILLCLLKTMEVKNSSACLLTYTLVYLDQTIFLVDLYLKTLT